MNDLAQAIASLPGETRVSVTIGGSGPTIDELAEAFRSEAEPVYITTHEASRRYSRSPKWWAREAPSIPGAHKDRHWRLPVAGCEEHLARLIRPRRKRAPWHPKAATAQAVGHRPTYLETR